MGKRGTKMRKEVGNNPTTAATTKVSYRVPYTLSRGWMLPRNAQTHEQSEPHPLVPARHCRWNLPLWNSHIELCTKSKRRVETKG